MYSSSNYSDIPRCSRRLLLGVHDGRPTQTDRDTVTSGCPLWCNSSLRDTYHRGGIRWNPAHAASSQASSLSKRKRTKKCDVLDRKNSRDATDGPSTSVQPPRRGDTDKADTCRPQEAEPPQTRGGVMICDSPPNHTRDCARFAL